MAEEGGEGARVGWKKRGKLSAAGEGGGGEGECGIVLSDTKGGEKRVKRKGRAKRGRMREKRNIG